MADFVLFTFGQYDQWVNMNSEKKKQMQQECVAYFRGLKGEGSQLKNGGRAIYVRDEKTVVDGPYPETKEVLNGFVTFAADSMETAVSLVKGCPALQYGEAVQVFELSNH